MQKLKTIVTTAGRPDDLSFLLVDVASKELNIPYIERKKRSISSLAEQYNANILVAGKNRYEYYPKGATSPFFFHPNSAAFRLKRLLKGEQDPLIEACQLEKGDTFLDCTLGIGSDAIIAAYAVGNEGRVVGLEVDPYVAFVVKKGLETFETDHEILKECMQKINVVNCNAYHFLQKQNNNQFDIVYMDPMFDEIIEESNNFEALRQAGNHMPLTEKWVNEAKRVAKKRVVLKAHFRSQLFEQFHFERKARPTSKFHYGVIEVSNEEIKS